MFLKMISEKGVPKFSLFLLLDLAENNALKIYGWCNT